MQPKPGTSLRNLRGPKADVLATIAAAEGVSDHVKAYLTAVVEACPHAGVILDTHFATENGDFSQHIHLRKLY